MEKMHCIFFFGLSRRGWALHSLKSLCKTELGNPMPGSGPASTMGFAEEVACEVSDWAKVSQSCENQS